MQFSKSRPNSAFASSPSSGRTQSGSALIFCLVILTILTIIGVSSLSDTNMQSAMTRNAQLRLLAYNTAYSEIDAQIDDININNNRDILLDAKDSGEGGRELLESELHMNVVHSDESSTGEAANPMTQEMTFRLMNEEGTGAGVVVTQSSEAVFTPLIYEIESIAELDGTGTRSDQVQGISYLAPK